MIDDKMLNVALNHVGKWAALAEEWQTKYEEAVARAEAAEAEVTRLKLETLRANNEKKRADHYEAQASEAFTAGAEAMWGVCVDALEDKNFEDAALLVRALPIPAQEVK